MPSPQFSCLSLAPLLPGPCSVLPSWEYSSVKPSGAKAAHSLLILLIISGLMTLEAIWDVPFLDTSLLSLKSHLPWPWGRLQRTPAAEIQECAIWLTVLFLIVVLAIVKLLALAERKLQKGWYVCLGITGGPAIPRTPARMLWRPLRSLSRLPAAAPEIDRT